MTPVTGSACSCSCAVLGDLPAWIIGSDLLVEYALIAGVVAAGTSNYLQSPITSIPPVTGLHLPVFLQSACDPTYPGSGRGINLIAMLVALAIAALQIARTEVGARFNTVVVAMKVMGAVIVVAGAFYVNPANWSPFIPPLIHDVIASVVFAFVLGAARTGYAPARDGLLPHWFAKSHPKYNTP